MKMIKNAWKALAGVALLTLLVLPIVGCRTYYGYDDIHTENAESEEESKSEKNNEETFIVLNVTEEGVANAFCFHRWEDVLERSTSSFITGRTEYYADFNGDYWFEAPWVKRFRRYEPFGLTRMLGNSMNNPIGVLIGFGIFFPIDTIAFTYVGSWVSIGGVVSWIGGRMFGFLGNWELAKHGPGFFKMLSYMPLINFFFPWQTPPYMAEGKKSSKVPFPREDWIKTKTTKQKIVDRKEEEYKGNPVNIIVKSDDERTIYLTSEVTTDQSGNINLTEILQQAVMSKEWVNGAETFTLEIDLRDDSDTILKKRKFTGLVRKQFFPGDVWKDKRIYDTTASFTEKMLLLKKHHSVWKMGLFDETSFLDVERRVKSAVGK